MCIRVSNGSGRMRALFIVELSMKGLMTLIPMGVATGRMCPFPRTPMRGSAGSMKSFLGAMKNFTVRAPQTILK